MPSNFNRKQVAFIKILLLSVLSMTACSVFNRSPESGYSDNVERKNNISKILDSNYKKTAYELGLDPSKTLTDEQLQQISNRHRIQNLEKNLTSKKEKEQYSKILPWLQSDEEKVEFLQIPSLEGRQQWINNKKIWSRAQVPAKELKEIVDNQDITIGMPQDLVKKSWGEPQIVETSGNPIYKNERWKYTKQVSSSDGYKNETRIVYFEGGRVVGWDTE